MTDQTVEKVKAKYGSFESNQEEQRRKKDDEELKKKISKTDELKKLDKQIEQKGKNYAEYKIQKDLDQMEKGGYFDGSDRTFLLDQFEVFERNDKGELTGKINTAKLGELIYDNGAIFYNEGQQGNLQL